MIKHRLPCKARWIHLKAINSKKQLPLISNYLSKIEIECSRRWKRVTLYRREIRESMKPTNHSRIFRVSCETKINIPAINRMVRDEQTLLNSVQWRMDQKHRQQSQHHHAQYQQPPFIVNSHTYRPHPWQIMLPSTRRRHPLPNWLSCSPSPSSSLLNFISLCN